jgi:ribosomal protein S18 acetylase RimI-like enzyme
MNFTFRNKVRQEDLKIVRDILESTKFFYDFEIDVALELVQEKLDKGDESTYQFIFIEQDGKTVAYGVYGLVPCTVCSYDYYWMGVRNELRGQGWGKIIVNRLKEEVRAKGGKGIYIETSSLEKYIPTQKFYDKIGCELLARFKDFYAEGDDKLIYKIIP